MDRLAAMFERTGAEGRPAVLVFAPGGFPELDATVEIVEMALAHGADAFEIGVPFSDPLADGVTNQEAYQVALANGASLAGILENVKLLRDRRVEAPLLLMGYYNPIMSFGVERFTKEAASAGVDGLIVVDLPPQEAEELLAPAREAGLHVIFLLAPTSTDDRIAAVAREASGFIYCVSVTGVTGAREDMTAELGGFMGRVRSQTDVPLAVGFGISTREHVHEVGKVADAAVIGSAFVRMIGDTPRAERPGAIRAFLEEITGRESSHVPAAD